MRDFRTKLDLQLHSRLKTPNRERLASGLLLHVQPVEELYLDRQLCSSSIYERLQEGQQPKKSQPSGFRTNAFRDDTYVSDRPFTFTSAALLA